MTVEAPAHGEWSGLPHQRHAIDRPVAGGATDAFGDMDRMIEVNVGRKPVDFVPMNWPLFGKALAHRRQHSGVGIEL